MYAGHLGFALGAYSFRKTIPLWLLLIAAQLPDWLDAGACVINVDRGPLGVYTHGVVVVSACAVGLGSAYFVAIGDMLGAFIVGVTVASHYGLDYLTGVKPTWLGGPVIGLGLYDRPIVDVAMEGATILVGWLLYRRSVPLERRNDRMVYMVLGSLLAFQVVAGVAFYMKAGGQLKCY